MAATVTLPANFSSEAPLKAYGPTNLTVVPVDVTIGSYVTGGVSFSLPSSLAGFKVAGLVLVQDKSGANRYSVAGTRSTPLIQAHSAFNTEVANATDLSAVTLQALVMVYR